MMTPAKGRLQEETKMRVEYLVDDCRTFFKVRHDHGDWLHGEHDKALGAGNFLTALGLFAALNFAAKVHLHLIDPKAFTTEADNLMVKEAIVKARKLEELKPAAQKLIAPFVGGCNEEQAFQDMVRAMKSEIDLGLTGEEPKDIWKRYRNALTHMSWPTGMVLVQKSEKSSAEAERISKSGPTAFWKQAGQWALSVDRLLLDMDAILEWLCRQIEQCEHDERIDAALKWIGKT
jgi:hypothetical protein